MLEEVHQASCVTSWGTAPLDILRTPFSIIYERQAWYHPDETESLLNIFSVGVKFCMKLATAMTLWLVTRSLNNCIGTTVLVIFSSSYSNKNGRGPRVGRSAFDGLWLSQCSVEKLTLIPIFFSREFESSVGVTILLATALWSISHIFFAIVALFLSDWLDTSANITSSINGSDGSTRIS